MKKHEQFDWNADSCSYREYDADADWEGINLKCFWKMHEKCKEIRVYHSSPVKEVTAVHQFRETPGTFIKVHWWDQVIFESQRVISLKFFKVHWSVHRWTLANLKKLGYG